MIKSEQLNRPYVGIIKSVVKDRGFGFIMIEYQKDVYFQLKECHIKDITPLTYVAFRKRISSRTNRIEAYDIRHVSDYKKELLEIEKHLLVSERDLIYYCNKDLFDKMIEEKTKNEVSALEDIDTYIGTFDIMETVNSYNVTVEEGHIYKPGDDDTAMVDYVGKRTKGVYLFQKGSFPGGYDWQRDVYIDKLLPEYTKNIFYERAFCPWSDLLAGFGDLTEYRKKAEESTQNIRKKAITLYDKDEHRECLINFLNNKINRKVEEYREDIEKSLQGSLSFAFNLDIKLRDMKY